MAVVVALDQHAGAVPGHQLGQVGRKHRRLALAGQHGHLVAGDGVDHAGRRFVRLRVALGRVRPDHVLPAVLRRCRLPAQGAPGPLPAS